MGERFIWGGHGCAAYLELILLLGAFLPFMLWDVDLEQLTASAISGYTLGLPQGQP